MNDRLSFLTETAAFRRIDLHWCLTFDPAKTDRLQRKPREEVDHSARLLFDLQKTVTILEAHLGSALGLRLLGRNEVFQFFSTFSTLRNGR